MKTILLAVFLVVTSHCVAAPKPKPTLAPTAVPSPTPLSEADRQKVTQQRDTLVEGLYTKLVDTQKELSSAQNIHKSDLGIEGTLLEKTNGMATTIVDQKTQIDALKKSLKLWKCIVAIEAGLTVWFLCLWLKLPNLSPPWGLVATVLAGPLAYGLCMLL